MVPTSLFVPFTRTNNEENAGQPVCALSSKVFVCKINLRTAAPVLSTNCLSAFTEVDLGLECCQANTVRIQSEESKIK
jgi:hypothetical protein